ncbi:MAG TPA: hypothetical protein DC058_01535, partial [Planctomycetaceae bacterium]|nr:hypothetical protein [Planctomycetaceae bacterium]
ERYVRDVEVAGSNPVIPIFFNGSRSTKKSNGFFFVVTSNLLNPAAMNVLFPAISALNHFSTVDPRRYVTADGRIDESHG